MKHHTIRYTAVHQPMYPNAADDRYFARKALEILTAILTGTGTVTAMLLLAAMA